MKLSHSFTSTLLVLMNSASTKMRSLFAGSRHIQCFLFLYSFFHLTNTRTTAYTYSNESIGSHTIQDAESTRRRWRRVRRTDVTCVRWECQWWASRRSDARRSCRTRTTSSCRATCSSRAFRRCSALSKPSRTRPETPASKDMCKIILQ